MSRPRFSVGSGNRPAATDAERLASTPASPARIEGASRVARSIATLKVSGSASAVPETAASSAAGSIIRMIAKIPG
ncbi:hypothetical protein [Sphingopyxis sp. GW247-27LB]|uniref:hypothetical protein n=1 Tax=Sphingopyxis sp. GW247-27LB TaxID=2012632 RepID=UPI0020D0F05F|nr:hypothetical protein [Sphingopyxis sp. GW247-27LB]